MNIFYSWSWLSTWRGLYNYTKAALVYQFLLNPVRMSGVVDVAEKQRWLKVIVTSVIVQLCVRWNRSCAMNIWFHSLVSERRHFLRSTVTECNNTIHCFYARICSDYRRTPTSSMPWKSCTLWCGAGTCWKIIYSWVSSDFMNLCT